MGHCYHHALSSVKKWAGPQRTICRCINGSMSPNIAADRVEAPPAAMVAKRAKDQDGRRPSESGSSRGRRIAEAIASLLAGRRRSMRLDRIA
jgi:hypothetical protein